MSELEVIFLVHWDLGNNDNTDYELVWLNASVQLILNFLCVVEEAIGYLVILHDNL